MRSASKYCVAGLIVLLALSNFRPVATAQDDVWQQPSASPATKVHPQETEHAFLLQEISGADDSSQDFVLVTRITTDPQPPTDRLVTSASWTEEIPEEPRPYNTVFLAKRPAIPQPESESLPRPESPEPRNDDPVRPLHFQALTPNRLPLPMSEPVITGIDLLPLGCGCGTTGCQGCGIGESHFIGRTRAGRFVNGLFHGVCQADPCYQPEWTMLVNASLFTDSLRPQSRQRYRWEYNDNYRFPDRAEYLWAKSGGKGPAAVGSINLHVLSMYVETGSERFSFFVETPYRSMYLDDGRHFAGFADLTTGTKTLLHDSRLLQVAMQFETHIPTSSPRKGLGNGHIALEPSLLFGLQISERSFLQTQISEWIPIAGDSDYAGALLKYSASLNRTLLGEVNSTSLIGTIEFSGISFQDGAYTDPVTLLPIPASNHSLGRLGGGLRLNICNKINVGFGAQFGLTDDAPDAMVRTEIQFRH